MKPYFEEDGITIYHGDCREVLPELNQVDLLLTDPPYGIGWRSTARQFEMEGISGDEDTSAALEGLSAALPVLRRQRHIYSFGRWDLKSIGLGGVCELIWDKTTTGRPLSETWVSQHEYITFGVNRDSQSNIEKNGGGNGSARLQRGTVLRFPIHPTLHPTEKPVELLRELIESSSRIGETVLDFFMGSGSTLVAAKLEGRRAIGIEIEEKYCEIAAKRLSQKVFNFGE